MRDRKKERKGRGSGREGGRERDREREEGENEKELCFGTLALEIPSFYLFSCHDLIQVRFFF